MEPTAIASEVVKAMAEHKSQASGMDSFMFLGALMLLFAGSFLVIKWMMTHNQTCVREITTDHKDACKTLTDTFREETKILRAEHTEDRRVFREGLHTVRNAGGALSREGSG